MRRKHLIWSLALCGVFSLGACSSAPLATNTPPMAAVSTPVISSTTMQVPSTTKATTPPDTVPANPCAAATLGWDTLADSTPIKLVRGQISDIRVGQHACFDRIVIEVSTTELVGVQVGYVPSVSHVGSGKDVAVEGGAILRIDINAPATTYNNVVSFEWQGNWPALKQVASAGSLEGMTVLAAGVDHKVPFAAYLLADTDTHAMRVIIDIAHT